MYLLESIDVLGVVPQQFPVLLDCPDEFVAGRRLELTRIDLSGELEKGPGVLAEVIDVEHGLQDKEEMIFMYVTLFVCFLECLEFLAYPKTSYEKNIEQIKQYKSPTRLLVTGTPDSTRTTTIF